MILAWLAAKGGKPFGTATFMVSMQDFAQVGETSFFMGEATIDFIEQQMMERGYLDSREMSNMFNLLRSNDLIWANVVNNYLMGDKPPAFDLLYWNSDGTRMARAAHSWYLRNTYVENNLIKPGKVKLKGEPIDLGRIEQDIYAVGAEKDHIVPWDAAWRITQLTGGKVRFVLASSGHIAGIINQPGPKKGAYWVNEEPAASPEDWLDAAAKHEGSWWTDWVAWLGERSGDKVKPPALGSEKYPPWATRRAATCWRSSRRRGSNPSSGLRGCRYLAPGVTLGQATQGGLALELLGRGAFRQAGFGHGVKEPRAFGGRLGQQEVAVPPELRSAEKSGSISSSFARHRCSSAARPSWV